MSSELARANLGSPTLAQHSDVSTRAGGPGLLEEPPVLLRLWSLIRTHLRVLVALPLLAAVGTGIVALLLPKQYTTVVSFTSLGGASSLASLSSLAGQFGVNLPSADPAASPDFYAALLQTREILQPIAERRYAIGKGRDSTTKSFIELYDISGSDSGRTLAEAMQVLQRSILTIGFDRQTGIVSLRIRTKWPELSYQMGQYTVALLNEFNLQSRQTQASAEKAFLGERLDTARAEVRAAENRLQDFLLRNRSYQNDPILAFDHDRLQRELTLRQEVFSTLTQSFEQARISSVRNTPSVSFVETPKLALRYDRRYVLVKVAIAAFVGVFAAVVWVLGQVALAEAGFVGLLRWGSSG